MGARCKVQGARWKVEGEGLCGYGVMGKVDCFI